MLAKNIAEALQIITKYYPDALFYVSEDWIEITCMPRLDGKTSIPPQEVDRLKEIGFSWDGDKNVWFI